MKNWPVHSLVDVTNLITCGVAKKPNYVDSGVPFLSAKNVKNGKVIWSEHKYITQEDHNELTKHNKPLPGDILYTRVGSFGEAAIIDSYNEFSVFVSLTLIKPKHDILISEYLKYYLNSSTVKELAKASISGSGVGNLNVGTVRKFPIPLPSISEQKRIVALLDTVFTDLEQTRAKTEQNLKNARELFESYLQQVFSSKDDNIKSTELGEVVDVLTDYHANGSYKVLKQHVELSDQEDFAWMVRSTDFEKKFQNSKRYISEHAYNYLTKSKLFGGEIIMSKIGNAGKVYLMPETDRACSLAMNLFLIRLDASKANNEYVYRYLNSSSGKAQIAPRLKGAATQTITKDNVRSLLIPLPSLVKQKEHILALQELEVETKALETLYLRKLDKIDELKKSILQKAFSGELTTETK